MNLKEIVEKIDSLEISGYPVNEDNVILKCKLIEEGLELLENDTKSAISIEFIKRIFWFGFELGSNKALEMSKYVAKQIEYTSKSLKVAPIEAKKVFG